MHEKTPFIHSTIAVTHFYSHNTAGLHTVQAIEECVALRLIQESYGVLIIENCNMKKCDLTLLLLITLLVSANAATLSARSNDVPAGCIRPYHIRLVSITDNSVTLAWQGNAGKYDYLCVIQEDMAALNIVSQGVFVDDTAVTLTGLRPGGVYCFRVRGHCGRSVSAWSQDFYFRTLCGSQKLPYSETFEVCSGTGVTALPPCWNAFCVVNDSAFMQTQVTNVYPVATSAINGKKSLALKEEAVEGTLLTRKRSYVVMPMFAQNDGPWQLSFDAVGMGSDTVRLVVGLVDRIDNIEMMEAIDTIELSSRRQQYDTVLLGWRLTGRHIVFYNIGGIRQPMSDHYTLLIDNVQLRKVAKAEQKPPYCPHPLVMVKKENIMEQSALVTWNDVGDRYELQWKEQSSSKWSKSLPLRTNSYNLTGLKSDTKYMVRVRSVCKANKYSVWSSAGFITKAPAYCPYPYVWVGEENTTEHSALVAWDGENDSYELQWKKESSSAWSKAVSLNGYSYVITGLEPETRYIVQVRGMCDGKDYSTWTPAVFTTKPRPEDLEPPITTEPKQPVVTPTVEAMPQPCPEVESFRVAHVGTSKALLEWFGRTNIYALELVGYDEYHLPRNVIHSEVSLGSAATIPTAEVPRSYSYSLNELIPDKDYEVRIRTRCADGRYGGWSERVSFHTMADEDTLSFTDTIDADDIPIEEMIEEEIVWLFSVSSTKQVEFAPGNLSKDGRSFVEHQWEYGGLFGWGTGNNPNKRSVDNKDYKTFHDWGENIEGAWRTLSRAEWNYMLFKRLNAKNKVGYGRVNNVAGLIVLPDNWVQPVGYTFRTEGNTYTISMWLQMEAAGAVFLPSAGCRLFNDDDNNDGLFAGESGCYWSSTPDGSDNAYEVNFGDAGCLGVFDYDILSNSRQFGYSVRLVRDVK